VPEARGARSGPMHCIGWGRVPWSHAGRQFGRPTYSGVLATVEVGGEGIDLTRACMGAAFGRVEPRES
jgi:hypothetical protein